MAAMSNYLENKLIDHIFRGVALPALPASLHIALLTADPTETGSMASEVSTSGTNYARAVVTRATTSAGWAATDAAGSTAATSAGTSGTTSNNSAIPFNAPGGTGWGVISHVAVMDSAIGGSNNMLFYGQLTTPKTVNANDAAPSFAVGQMIWQIDN